MKRGNYYFFEKGYQPLKCNYDQDLEGNQITQSDALSSKWHVNRADIQKNIKNSVWIKFKATNTTSHVCHAS